MNAEVRFVAMMVVEPNQSNAHVAQETTDFQGGVENYNLNIEYRNKASNEFSAKICFRLSIEIKYLTPILSFVVPELISVSNVLQSCHV